MPGVADGNRITLAMGDRHYIFTSQLLKAVAVLDWRPEPAKIDLALEDNGRYTYMAVWPHRGDSAVLIHDAWRSAGLYPTIGLDQNDCEYVWIRLGD